MIDITTESYLGPSYCRYCDKEFTDQEEELVFKLHRNKDNKWVYACWHRECLRNGFNSYLTIKGFCGDF